jgi:hypothetical protein
MKNMLKFIAKHPESISNATNFSFHYLVSQLITWIHVISLKILLPCAVIHYLFFF